VGETTPGGSRSEKKWRETLFKLAPPTFTASPPARNLAGFLKPGKFSVQGRTRSGPPLVYVRVRSITEAIEVKRQGLWHLVVELSEENYNDYLRHLRAVKKLKGLIWQLPAIMYEGSLSFYRQAVATLLDGGWRHFMVGNLGHLDLLKEALAVLGQPAVRKSRRAGGSDRQETAAAGQSPGQAPPKLTLYSDYTLHCLNSLTFQALQDLGVDYPTLSVEADKETLQLLFKNLPGYRLLVYIYGHLPLMVSRVPLPESKKALRLMSPRGEQFRLLSRGELTYLIAKFPYLLQKPLSELLPQGLSRVIVDLNNSGLPASEIGGVVRRLLSGGPQITGGLPLNYYRGLE
jgi:putative protease